MYILEIFPKYTTIIAGYSKIYILCKNPPKRVQKPPQTRVYERRLVSPQSARNIVISTVNIKASNRARRNALSLFTW